MSHLQQGRVGVPSTTGQGWCPIYNRAGLVSRQQQGRVGVPTTTGQGWCPIYNRAGLVSRQQQGRVGVPSTTGQFWCPVNYRAGLVSHQRQGGVSRHQRIIAWQDADVTLAARSTVLRLRKVSRATSPQLAESRNAATLQVYYLSS